MTSELKCPFCGEELVRYWGMESPAIYCCDNQKCSRGGIATESAWQALIQTKQDLEIATNALREICNDYQEDSTERAEKALKKIEHKE